MEWQSFVNDCINSFIKDKMFTAIPASVEKVSNFGTKQTIDAKPLINKIERDDTVIEPSIIPNVPVIFPSAANGILSFPIKEGDTVLLIYSMRSMEEWLEGTGRLVTPSDSRTFNKTDAIAIPGLYTKSSHINPNPTDAEFRFNDLIIALRENGDIELTNSTSSIKIGSDQQITLTNGSETFTLDNSQSIILDNGSATVTLKPDGSFEHSSGAMITAAGDFISATGKSLNLHIHNQPNDTGGDTQSPTSPPV